MVDPVSIGAGILASSTVNYLYGKGKRLHFLNEAVENAASQVAENYEGLDSDVFIHIFQDDEVIELVKEFDDGDGLITPEDIAHTFADDILNEEVEASSEELVLEFLNQLEVEISQNQEMGHKLLMEYTQRIHQYTEGLEEGQEEILFEIQEIEGRLPTSKGYDIFQPITERFGQQLNGDDPNNRYDLPLFGRESELERVSDIPESDDDVLILSGRAGIGKTRLVVEGSLLLETEHPDWRVYWTDIDAGNIDDGLEELELGERNTILFIDDARDRGQISRLFQLVDQHQPDLRLIFAERPHFLSSLRSHANRHRSLQTSTFELSRLSTDEIHEILREYYGITHPSTLDHIVAISEGLPLFAHLLARQLTEGEVSEGSPIAQDEALESVFEDILNDVQSIAEQEGIGNPRRLETYVEYLAAVGELDTDNNEQVQEFRETLDIDRVTELDFREALIDNFGLVTEQSDRLTIQPDALQEYIVYNSFFSDSSHDYQNEIYSNFSQYTGKSQINQLATIHRRYECREARKTIRDAVYSEKERMGEYGFAARVKLLRRFKVLGSTHPHHAIELVKNTLREELPEGQEEEKLRRSSMYTANPAGDLLIESIDILSNALHEEPEEATALLLRIAMDHPDQSQLRTQSVEQQLKEAMRPGFRKSPASQQEILAVIGDHFLLEEFDKDLRLKLLDIIGEASDIEIHDFSVDPVDRSQMRSWQGDVQMTEPQVALRKQAVDLLIDIVREDPHPEVRKKAAKKLVGFENTQARYYEKHQEIISERELTRILEFATEYVLQDEDLQCIDTLSKLVDRENSGEFGVEDEVDKLQEALEENERYQLLQNMRHRPPKKMEERKAEIRRFAEGLNEEELEPSDFADILSELTSTSFNQFFRVLANERPDYGVKLLEADDSDLSSCKPQVLVGICASDPGMGKELVDQYIEEEQFELASAGLSALASQDLEFVKEKVNHLLEERYEIPPELVWGLSQVVHGNWEDHKEWTEDVLLTLLQDAESLSPRSIKRILQPLPLHNEDSENVDEGILEETLDYARGRERLGSEPHSINYVIAESAEQDPKQFVDFCFQRIENEYIGTALLPSHLDIDTERMKQAGSYDDAIQEVSEQILDTDYYRPTAFSDLTGTFPISDIADELIPEIPDCSEKQLIRIIWYCKMLPITEGTERIYRTVVTVGVDNILEAEDLQDVIYGALYTDALASRSLSGVSKKEDELEMLRNWQNDTSLSSSIQIFAEEAEDYLMDSIEQQKDRLEDF